MEKFIAFILIHFRTLLNGSIHLISLQNIWIALLSNFIVGSIAALYTFTIIYIPIFSITYLHFSIQYDIGSTNSLNLMFLLSHMSIGDLIHSIFIFLALQIVNLMMTFFIKEENSLVKVFSFRNYYLQLKLNKFLQKRFTWECF